MNWQPGDGGIDNLPDRVVNKILFEPNTGHWLWLGKRQASGYGKLWTTTGEKLIHRYVYQAIVGPIPTGYCIDHICRVRHCVSPNHLRVVTAYQNSTENSRSPHGLNAVKTHCKYGHPFDQQNTRIVPRGRHCRACEKQRQDEYTRTGYWQRRDERRRAR